MSISDDRSIVANRNFNLDRCIGPFTCFKQGNSGSQPADLYAHATINRWVKIIGFLKNIDTNGIGLNFIAFA